MSRFYGSIRGTGQTEATRAGSAVSGLTAHIRGWNVGIVVECVDIDGTDRIDVRLTGGSNGAVEEIPIGSFTVADLEVLLAARNVRRSTGAEGS